MKFEEIFRGCTYYPIKNSGDGFFNEIKVTAINFLINKGHMYIF